MPGVARRLAAVVLVVAAVACSNAPKRNSGTDPGHNVSIPVRTAGGTFELSGVDRGSGSVGVLLAHMLGSDQEAWAPLIPALLGDGFHVLTFNFRGHGLSGGTRDPSAAAVDIAAAVAKFHSLGVSKILVVGASMGGTGALVAATDQHFTAVVTISAPAQIGSLDAQPSVGRIRVPVLFIAGAGDDKRYVDSARSLYAAASQPKRLDIVAGSSAHGTDLLIDPKVGAAVRRTILQFLLDNRG